MFQMSNAENLDIADHRRYKQAQLLPGNRPQLNIGQQRNVTVSLRTAEIAVKNAKDKQSLEEAGVKVFAARNAVAQAGANAPAGAQQRLTDLEQQLRTLQSQP